QQLLRTPATPRTHKDTTEDDAQREVQPDRRLEAIPEAALREVRVRPGDHPTVPGRGLGDAAVELLGVGGIEADPVRQPVQGIEFDEGHADRLGELRGEGALTCGGVSDDVNATADG